MIFDSMVTSSEVTNLTVDSGSSFPAEPSNGELFFREDESQLYLYNGTDWTQISGVAAAAIPKISSIIVTDNSYTALDDTAVGLDGGYVKITGSNFVDGCTVKFSTFSLTPTFVSASELRVAAPALSAGSYTMYVVNPDGSTAIKVNGIVYSAFPVSTTPSSLSGVTNETISIQLTAPAAVTYVLQSGSSLPSGLTLSSSGLLSGTIIVQNTTTYTFTVLASDAENQTVTIPVSLSVSSVDTDTARTGMLLKVTDSSATDNNTIIDSSSNNFTITRNGNVSQGAVSPFSGAGWSTYYSGATGDATSVSANSAFNPRTTTTTFECWVFPTARSTGSSPTQVSNIIDFYTAYNNRCEIWINSNGYLGIGRDNGTGAVANASTTLIPLNAWTHVAWVWDGTSNKFFVNGQDVTSTFSNPTLSGQFPLSITSPAVYIGGGYYGNGGTNWVDPFAGFISNARLIKGSVLYTANFTPSTSALTAVTGSVLLLNSTSFAKDLSSNNFTVTSNGNAEVMAFSPFSPTYLYSSATNGGSMYFDGTGDYLTATSPNLSGDWTVECWWNPLNVTTQQTIISFNSGSFTGIHIWCNTSGQLVVDNGQTTQTAFTAGTIKAKQWNHIAVSRSGTTTRGYINGSLVGSNTFTPSTINSVSVGRYNASPFYYLTGYLSNVRVVNGTALYTSNFTPANSPLTAVSGTSLLLSGGNGKIIDALSKSNIETVGNVSTSSTTSKFSQSIYFADSSRSLKVTTGPHTLIGLQDFTIEFWLNTLSPTTGQTLYNNRVFLPNGEEATLTNQAFSIGISTVLSTVRLNVATRINTLISGPALQANTWYHVALCRSSAGLSLFVNGVAYGGGAYNSNITGSSFDIAGVNTYIEDFRFSKFARYTAAFTPQSTTFIAK